MRRIAVHTAVGALTCGCLGLAWTSSYAQTTLRARTNLVLVPTLVETKSGEPVFNLAAKDFLVTDNGVEQKIRLDTDTDRSAISMVVLVQTGRSAIREFHNYQGLPTMVEALAGDAQHRIAVVAFDSRPQMLLNFTNEDQSLGQAIYSIRPGDGGDAILDAAWYAVDMLADEPSQNQRVILLLSETRDHGSRTPIREVVRKIGQTDAMVYSLTFSPSHADLIQGLTNPEWGGSANLLAPLMMTIQALRKNTAAAIPRMTGGQYLRFNQGKQLDKDLGMLANQVHNRYILSFQPTNSKPGLHLLNVSLRQPLDVRILARTSYWSTAAPGVIQETPAISPPSLPKSPPN
jgi:VWFA-related protein